MQQGGGGQPVAAVDCRSISSVKLTGQNQKCWSWVNISTQHNKPPPPTNSCTDSCALTCTHVFFSFGQQIISGYKYFQPQKIKFTAGPRLSLFHYCSGLCIKLMSSCGTSSLDMLSPHHGLPSVPNPSVVGAKGSDVLRFPAWCQTVRWSIMESRLLG